MGLIDQNVTGCSRAQTPRRTQRERSAEAEARLVTATIDCLRERGWAGVTVGRIARRAGFTLGAVQHHFGGKASLIMAAHDAALGDLESHLEAVSEATDLDERCSRTVEALGNAYRQPSFPAALEIFLGTRSDPVLSVELKVHRTKKLAAYGSEWLRIFGDTGRSEEELLGLLQATLAFLRGWALLAIEEDKDEVFVGQNLLLCNFLRSQIAGFEGTPVRTKEEPV